MTLDPSDREEMIAKMMADYKAELDQLRDDELYHTFKVMADDKAVTTLVEAMHAGLTRPKK